MSEYVMSSELLQRLAGSLLHFLWQGALLALAAVIVLRLMARRSSESRYATAVVTMGFMLAAPVFTFVFYAETGSVALRVMQLARASAADMAHSGTAPQTLRWAASIVAIWALGFGVCSIRLITGWLLSLRIIRAAKESVPTRATELMERVRAQLLERRPIRLLVGKNVDTPVVFGWIRPVLLLPLSAATGLNEAQLFAVLAHELAHIRRHDFMVNTLQRSVECILFYHPAVWWISGRIRVERERCCDDLAVRVCGDRKTYAAALIALEGARSSQTGLAVAATGAGLADRVRRILGVGAKRDWQSAVAGMVFTALLLTAGLWEPRVHAEPRSTPPVVEAALPASDLTPLSALAAIATAQASVPQQTSTARTGPGQRVPDITGRWVVTGVSYAPWTFEFIADGNTFTGSIRQNYGSFPGPAPFEGGRIDGNKIAFKVKATSPGWEQDPGINKILTFTGTLDGDQIVFSKSMELLPGGNPGSSGLFGAGGSAQFTARRETGETALSSITTPSSVATPRTNSNAATTTSVPATIFAGAAQDLNGTWVVTGVPYAPWILEFKTAGAKLSGTVRETGGDTAPVPIVDGVIRGNTLTFKAKSPDGVTVVGFTGVLNGADLIFIHSVESPEGSRGGPGIFGSAVSLFTAKREARQPTALKN